MRSVVAGINPRDETEALLASRNSGLEGVPVPRRAGRSAKGKANGAWKHGQYSTEARAYRRSVRYCSEGSRDRCEAKGISNGALGPRENEFPGRARPLSHGCDPRMSARENPQMASVAVGLRHRYSSRNKKRQGPETPCGSSSERAKVRIAS